MRCVKAVFIMCWEEVKVEEDKREGYSGGGGGKRDGKERDAACRRRETGRESEG